MTALRDMTVEVGDEIVELAVNEVNRTLVEDEVVLAIPNVARMRVSAGPESKGLAHQRRKTQESYRRLCEGVGVADATEARRAAQERQDAQRDKEEAFKAIERELRDLTPDVLLGKVKNVAERVTSYPKERPENPPLPRISTKPSGLRRKCQAWSRIAILSCVHATMLRRMRRTNSINLKSMRPAARQESRLPVTATATLLTALP